MQYPKLVMHKKELLHMGFTESFLMEAYRSKGQDFAWKSGSKPNSPLLFDTIGLEKYRLAKCGLGR